MEVFWQNGNGQKPPRTKPSRQKTLNKTPEQKPREPLRDCIVLYCIVSINLYSASCSAHQSEALPVRETQREESREEKLSQWSCCHICFCIFIVVQFLFCCFGLYWHSFMYFICVVNSARSPGNLKDLDIDTSIYFGGFKGTHTYSNASVFCISFMYFQNFILVLLSQCMWCLS